MKRGISTVADVRARCTIDQATRCWNWTGAVTIKEGTPRIHAVDLRDLSKKTLSGPLAVWMIAHEEVPWGLVYRRCVNHLCLNPAHLKLARDKAEIGRHISLAGTRKGTHLEARRASIKLAMAASGVTQTPASIVLAIRDTPREITNIALGQTYGLSPQTISRIRRGESHRYLLEAA